MSDSRAEFEAWFNNDDGRCCEPSGYESPHVAALWASWKAARKATLEEAAKTCEDIGDEYDRTEGGKWPELKSDAKTGAGSCEAAIRSLADRSPT